MDILREHYPKYVQADFFPAMTEYLTSGPVVLLILERKGKNFDPVQSLIDLSGPTDPKKGLLGQIRHDFGLHYYDPKHPGWYFYNAIHRSDPGEVATEIARFFPKD